MKQTIRTTELKKNYSKRMNIIKGQMEGIIKMIDDDAYCINVIDQINAIRGSLNAISRKLTHEHIDGCITNSHNPTESLNEIKELIERLSK